jgi:hypothetical protein
MRLLVSVVGAAAAVLVFMFFNAQLGLLLALVFGIVVYQLSREAEGRIR